MKKGFLLASSMILILSTITISFLVIKNINYKTKNLNTQHIYTQAKLYAISYTDIAIQTIEDKYKDDECIDTLSYYPKDYLVQIKITYLHFLAPYKLLLCN